MKRLFFSAWLAFSLALIPALTRADPSTPPMKAVATPQVTYVLKTAVGPFGMAFIGVGGTIDGQHNPTLHVPMHAQVHIQILDGDGSLHNLAIPTFHVQSSNLTGPQSRTEVTFAADQAGQFDYYCNIPGHRMVGMAGKLVVGTPKVSDQASLPDLSRAADDLPPPLGARGPRHVTFHLITSERQGRLANGTAFTFWTFNGKVPGPLLRAKVGDTITVELHNDAHSSMTHSIDLHAVSGPGGGAGLMQVPPGHTQAFTFKALHAGLFVYHCATPMVAEHIANGMYGMILIEPRQGLPKVAHEYYVMQGEVYTREAFEQPGEAHTDTAAIVDEHPTYVVFNGSVGALTQLHPLRARTGQTLRVFFGVGGPNLTSSFHVIGMVMKEAWIGGSLANPPLHGMQTLSVPPGSALMVTLATPVPGTYLIVDHALGRLNQGMGASLVVTGKNTPEDFHSGH